MNGYRRLHTRFTALARRPNPALQVIQPLTGAKVGTSGLLNHVYRLAERFYIRDAEMVFEVRPHGRSLRLLDSQGKLTDLTVIPDPQNPGQFMQGPSFDATAHLADLDPSLRADVDLEQVQPRTEGVYKGVYTTVDANEGNLERHYGSDGVFSYELYWDADQETWRLRRGANPTAADDPLEYDQTTGQWRRRLQSDASQETSDPDIATDDREGLTAERRLHALTLTKKAKASGITLLSNALRTMNAEPLYAQKLARYFFGWDSEFIFQHNVENKMAGLKKYAAKLRKRLAEFEPESQVAYHHVIENEPYVVARSDVGAYSRKNTPYMDLSLRNMEEDIVKYGAERAEQRLGRTLVHEFTHLLPPTEYLPEVTQVIDSLYVPRFARGQYDLTDIVMHGLYDSNSAVANADSYAHYFTLMQVAKEASAGKRIIQEIDAWYAQLESAGLQPLDKTLKARARITPSLQNESSTDKLFRVQEMQAQEARHFIKSHHLRLAPSNPSTVAERTVKQSEAVAADRGLRKKLFGDFVRKDPANQSYAEKVQTAWQAELRVEESALSISQSDSQRLALQTTPRTYADYLHGPGQAIMDLDRLRRLPAGWRIALLDENDRMVHAMLSHGNGSFAGFGNEILAKGYFNSWSVMDLASRPDILTSAGEGVFWAKEGKLKLTIRAEQYVPMSSLADNPNQVAEHLS